MAPHKQRVTSMKHSEAIKQGLLFYGHDDFMCNVLRKMSTQTGSPITYEQVTELKRLINKRIGGKYTLNCHMRTVSETYSAFHERDISRGWEEPEPFAMRVAFWNDFIVELESKGL